MKFHSSLRDGTNTNQPDLNNTCKLSIKAIGLSKAVVRAVL